jgi:uncharacterized protein YecT (DUF1311 family)
MKLFRIVLVLLPLLAGLQDVHKPSDKIEKEELSAYLAKQFGCEAEEVEAVYFWSVDQFDFLGKGYDQAVVVASTCMTGTAGPDVHSVFTRDDKGELKELKIEEVKMEHRVLFGNANSGFRVENGLLVQRFWDTSGRDAPLLIKYKWDAAKEQFTAVSVEAAKPYRTSYDCAKAEEAQDETAQAICYVKSLADLDIELAGVYKAYLDTLTSAERRNAIEEQRNWLAKRNADCGIYKWWVECLTDKYNGRISELRQKMHTDGKAKVNNEGSAGVNAGGGAAVAVR